MSLPKGYQWSPEAIQHRAEGLRRAYVSGKSFGFRQHDSGFHGGDLTLESCQKTACTVKGWWESIRGTEKEAACLAELRKGSAATNIKSNEKLRKSLKEWWSNPKNKAEIKARNEAIRKAVRNAWREGKYNNDEWHKNQAESQRQSWENDPTRAKRCLGFRRPNKLERYLDGILQEYFPSEWKYVGNGEVKIGRKNPDWININGFKGVIELFGMRWHLDRRTESEITAYYAQYGFKCLIIKDDGHGELNLSEQQIVDKVKQWRGKYEKKT
jgi:hypothetical protein